MYLCFENISFGYSRENKILDDCSFKVDNGNIYALVGSNGAGKTTLFNLVTGFLPTYKGNIFFKGKLINNLSPAKIHRLGISRTFQDLRIITKLTVKENIILAMKGNPTEVWYKALLPNVFYEKRLLELENKADNIVREYFLNLVKNNLGSEISYGQQKLLTIAACVASNSDLLVLDEPVASINPDYRQKIAFLVKQLKNEGKTIVLIEHNSDFIKEVADSVLFLNEGKITQHNSL